MLYNFLIILSMTGIVYKLIKIFGAHFETYEGKKGVRFTTYAPNAKKCTSYW